MTDPYAVDANARVYLIVDEFSPWPGSQGWYSNEGIDKLRQVWLTGSRANGKMVRVHHSADACCFG